MKTYNELYLDARKTLRAAGIKAYNLEARLIVERATGKTREELLRDGGLFVGAGIERETDALLTRRIGGEPVAYIVGEWEFYGLPVLVNRSVLIPRADTEVLAEEAIAFLRRYGRPTRCLDLCCGTGCLGLAIAANAQPVRIVLADNCTETLKLCRANIQKNGLTNCMTAILLDVLEKPPALLGGFDLIVCNPPYIRTGDIETLDAEVRGFEPVSALDGGADGLDFYRAVGSQWSVLLREGGAMAFECGAGQADDVRAILRENGLTHITTSLDTLGIERVVIGMRETDAM